ncbi:hypothetical protein BT69DRAFT_1324933 [Atractiella rhizophila]|nr:hypothetical protein BT69DRAFT_1324933 [Atractiella rhizophila]
MQSLSERSYHLSSLALLRSDGRTSNEFRKRFISHDVSPLANGSARVEIGGTVVVAGAKVEIEPGSTARVGIDVEVAAAAAVSSTLSDPSFAIQSFLLSIYTPQSLSLPTLTRTRRLALSVHVIILSTDGGSVLDACALACWEALGKTRIPRFNVGVYKGHDSTSAAATVETGDMEGRGGGGGEDVWKTEAEGEIELLSQSVEDGTLLSPEQWPTVVTLHLAGKNLFVDATAEEELAASNRLSIAIANPSKSNANADDEDGDDDDGEEICGLQWEGEGEVGFDRLKEILISGGKVVRQLRGGHA